MGIQRKMGDIEVQIPLDERSQAAVVRGSYGKRRTPKEAVVHYQKVCLLFPCLFECGLARIDCKSHFSHLAIIACNHQSVE